MIKLEVSTHSGDNDLVLVDDYNHDEMVKTINDDSTHAVLIGKNIYSRIDLKNIKVVEKENAE